MPALIACRVAALGHGPQCLRTLVSIVTAVCTRLKRAEVVSYHRALASFFISILDQRSRLVWRAASSSGNAMLEAWSECGEWERTEPLIVKAFMALVVKMTELELKPVFSRMLGWASIKSRAKVADGVKKKMPSAAQVRVTLHRRITFFALLRALVDRLKTIVVPYFEHVLPEAISVMRDAAVTAAAAVSGISPPRPTKGGRKRGGAAALGGREAKRVRLVGDAVSVVDELSVSDAVMVPELLLLQRVLAALQSFFYFDSIGFLTKERFERVQKPLANVLSAELVELLGGRQPFLSFASAHVSPCVCEMSAAAGSDLLWKPLNHSLLLRTRDASAAVRLAALRALYACFERIGAEYVVLLPEMIPFMAELLEDSDEEVERLALQLKQLAEKLSGESLDPYLNA